MNANMNKYKVKIIALILLSTQLSHSYTEVSVVCRVNNAPASTVSCDEGWTPMRSYPEVEIKLKDCTSSSYQQKIEVRIDNVVYTPNSLSNLEIKYRVDGYLIECFDQKKLTSF